MDLPRSDLSASHVVLLVADVGRSIEFYGRIGLPAFLVRDDIALIELRGGTHLILARRGSADAADMVSSRIGQMAPETGERFDLMLGTADKPDLETYRADLIGKGVEVGVLNAEEYFGHWYFQVRDPDGNVVSVYTSHEIKFMDAESA